MTRNGKAVPQVKRALEAYRSSVANQLPLRYAPWVLNLLLIVLTKDRMPTFSLGEWGWLAGALVGISALAGWARSALGRQRNQAVSELHRLLRRPGGAEAMLALRSTHPRLADTRLPQDLEHAIVLAVREAEADKERKRCRGASDTLNRKEPLQIG